MSIKTTPPQKEQLKKTQKPISEEKPSVYLHLKKNKERTKLASRFSTSFLGKLIFPEFHILPVRACSKRS